jgi:ABC-2 type transport system ATP-binding protein
MINIQNLTISYNETLAVDNVSIKFQPGKITGIIGPNGAGKSSLIKALVGLNMAFSGNISYEKRDLKKNRQWLKERLGYAPEDAEFLPYLTGSEYLEMMASFYKIDKPMDSVHFFLELAGLKSKESELILNYSHGMHQKISMVSALVGAPDFIVIDEALNGMDPISLFKIKKYLKNLANDGKTILITSHIISLIQQWCDPIFIMHEGRIIKKYTQKDIMEIEQKTRNSFEEHFVQLVNI